MVPFATPNPQTDRLHNSTARHLAGYGNFKTMQLNNKNQKKKWRDRTGDAFRLQCSRVSVSTTSQKNRIGISEPTRGLENYRTRLIRAPYDGPRKSQLQQDLMISSKKSLANTSAACAPRSGSDAPPPNLELALCLTL